MIFQKTGGRWLIIALLVSGKVSVSRQRTINQSPRHCKLAEHTVVWWHVCVLLSLWRDYQMWFNRPVRRLRSWHVDIKTLISIYILYSQVSNHLEQYEILTHWQHGFSSAQSCESQLIYCFEDWACTINSKTQVDVAFDMVQHEHLKSKLVSYAINVKSLLWISNFLQIRIHMAVVNGC